ncbi:MAG: protease modulator HflC [Rickettsiales bacterium]|nr:protease modulator HflC [Rickettsiales bacterium]
MTNKAKKILIFATVFMILFASTMFTVDQRQQVLITEFGKPVRVIKEPGINFKLPLIQEAIFFDKRIIDLGIEDQEVIASDQKRLIINAFAKYKITDPLKFYTTARTMQGLSNKIDGILDSSLRQVIGEVKLSELLTENRSDIMAKISKTVGEQAIIFGIEIVDVRIMRADLPKENSDAIFARMQTEREKEAREIRANGAEIAQKIRAEADKERTIIIANAQKDSNLTRGDGEAKANKIYAKSYNVDPEFADFYRSMQAYKTSLTKEKTKIVISPTSEFFRYFNNVK